MRGRILQMLLAGLAALGCNVNALAETVYRCGNAYHQIPCPDAEVLAVSDPRSEQERRLADAATQGQLARLNAQERSMVQSQARASSKPARAVTPTSKKPRQATTQRQPSQRPHGLKSNTSAAPERFNPHRLGPASARHPTRP